MNKLSLKAKFAVGFGSLLLILGATSIVSYFSVEKLSGLSSASSQKTIEEVLVRNIEAGVNKQDAEVHRYLLAHNQQDELADYDETGHAVSDSLAKLEPLVTTDQGKQLFSLLREGVTNYQALLSRALQMETSGRRDQARVVLLGKEGANLRDDMSTAINSFAELTSDIAESTRREQAVSESRIIVLIAILAIVGFLIGLSVAGLTARSILGAISGMISLIREIAANNLAVEDLAVASEDEIGKASVALNEMKNNLQEIIQSIAGTAEHVASASEEISSSAAQQAQSAETQKDQAAQVATAMQEMSSTVAQVSENSNKAAEASSQAAETARHGGAIVEETLEKMKAISDSVSSTARKMEELGKSSDQIGRIAGVIDDIADQTNLLALNAAIEAARAGEQGRGFAVVADEVRKLAERTTTATKEIAQMIQNIQNETRTAVTAMEEGTKQVEDGVKSTVQAGDSLKEIIHMSEQVGEMITHIATAATEQSSASEEVNNNMEQIARLVKEAAEGAQQSAKACQDLSGLALDLQKLVGTFKLGQNGHSYQAARPRSFKRGGDLAMRSGEPKPVKALAATASS